MLIVCTHLRYLTLRRPPRYIHRENAIREVLWHYCRPGVIKCDFVTFVAKAAFLTGRKLWVSNVLLMVSLNRFEKAAQSTLNDEIRKYWCKGAHTAFACMSISRHIHAIAVQACTGIVNTHRLPACGSFARAGMCAPLRSFSSLSFFLVGQHFSGRHGGLP